MQYVKLADGCNKTVTGFPEPPTRLPSVPVLPASTPLSPRVSSATCNRHRLACRFCTCFIEIIQQLTSHCSRRTLGAQLPRRITLAGFFMTGRLSIRMHCWPDDIDGGVTKTSCGACRPPRPRKSNLPRQCHHGSNLQLLPLTR